MEFASAVDAVTCSDEVQEPSGGDDGSVPEDRCIAFRIGLHVGDIIIDGDDIFGDGVNIAARFMMNGACPTVFAFLIGRTTTCGTEGHSHSMIVGKQTLNTLPGQSRLTLSKIERRASAESYCSILR